MSQDLSGADQIMQKMPQRVRHPLRFRRVQVRAVDWLAPRFVRITLGGEQLDGFISPGFDDHVKLFFPDPVSGALPLPEVGPEGPVWPENGRPVMRDYTPQLYDSQALTLAIDFALHESGPATEWATKAQPGDWIGIGGPRGSFLLPTDFDWHLLVGDETAIPAIARRLRELPASARALVLIEVGEEGDQISLSSAAQLQLQWCHRGAVRPGSSQVLLSALQQLSWPAGDGYAWVACETALARQLRAHLVEQRGMHPKRVKAAGYWRAGIPGAHERIED
jgi:NADPH-dependent ferric siderophore reductase